MSEVSGHDTILTNSPESQLYGHMSVAGNDSAILSDLWTRYTYMRDNGHFAFLEKALRCEDYVIGNHWDAGDRAELAEGRRPALTINKVLGVIKRMLGEQIFYRNMISYVPQSGDATSSIADALSKVFIQIGNENSLEYVRTHVFMDGIVTGRGYYDVRLGLDKNVMGKIEIDRMNPKSVLLDPDADSYEPKGWGDVVHSKWMSPDDISLYYSKAAGDDLRGRMTGAYPYSFDVLDYERDRFGTPPANTYWMGAESMRGLARMVRVLERQWKKLCSVEHFVDLNTGDMNAIPEGWNHNRISAYLQRMPNCAVTKKVIKRVMWTTVADDIVLKNEWSPYEEFTVVPFFPFLIAGTTVGDVENLMDPQQLLNKMRSQVLHVVNTTANSGYIVDEGALVSPSTPQELENRGAESGLVIVKKKGLEVTKIQPNAVPPGLQQMAAVAEEDIKQISLQTDYQTGNAREDVSDRALRRNQTAGQAGQVYELDGLTKSDKLLAAAVLTNIQSFYIEPRLIRITEGVLNDPVEVQVNQEVDGEILNDLTLGDYGVTCTSEPQRDTFDDTQFDQLVALRDPKIGIKVPDKYILMASKVRDKKKIVDEMDAAANSPQAQQEQQLKQRMLEAEIGLKEADVMERKAKAMMEMARAREITAKIGQDTPAAEADAKSKEVELEHQRKMRELAGKHELERQDLEHSQALEMEKHRAELQRKAELHAQDLEHKHDAALWDQATTLSQAQPPAQTNGATAPNGVANGQE
jgi:hypothetical protein